MKAASPLADRLRPRELSEIVGQSHLTGHDGWVTKTIDAGYPVSILLFGPPGCGKTTLARLYAKAFDGHFVSFSGVMHKTSDLKKVIEEARQNPLLSRHLIVFIDEIHRFNKAQQDALLPHVESGTITLIGATTENPSFSLNNALLSRLHTLTLNALTQDDLATLLCRYEASAPLPLTSDARDTLLSFAAGDGRSLFNMIESLSLAPVAPLLTPDDLPAYIQRKGPLYDRSDEGHYNLISALHKSVRGSDPDAALYWLSRMLQGGEDPQFLARRLIRMASEDIGLADPQALTVTLNAWQAYHQLGSPEGELALAQATIYLALAPKSNAAYKAFNAAWNQAQETGHLNPPKIILNAPTPWMKGQGYGKGYLYDHDQQDAFSGQDYFPDELTSRPSYYQPVERGFEREMQKRMVYFQKLKKKQPRC